MKKIILTLTLFLISFSPVLAQDVPAELDEPESNDTIIQDTEGLRLQMVQDTQDPGSKEIVFNLTLISKIDSDRVQITWQTTGAIELLTAERITLVVRPNQTYKVSATVRARTSGRAAVAEVRANVEAFEAEGTFTATARKTFGLLTDATVYPITDAYKTAQLFFYIKTGAIYLIGGAIAFGIAFFAYKRFRIWFDKLE